MKKIVTKTMILAAFAMAFTGCVQDDDAAQPNVLVPFYAENFNSIAEDQDGNVFDFAGWTNFAEKGTKLWTKEYYRGDGTPQFNPYGSGQAQNITWLISPMIEFGPDNLKPGFTFQSAQNFVSDVVNNTIEVYVSSDYDGTNVMAANWVKMNNVRIATPDDGGYNFVNAGSFDLSQFVEDGHVHIAFRAIGSGSNTSLDGLYQLNNLYVYNQK